MAIASGELITKQDLVDRFNLRVRDYVTANTNWISTTGVWDTNVGTVTVNSSAYAASTNRVTQATPAPSAIAVSDLNDIVGAKAITGDVVIAMRAFLVLYANNHRINLSNTGNYTPASYTGIARLNGVPAATVTNITNDVDSAATTAGINANTVVNASNLYNFIESCRTIWYNRCAATALETFYYSYCHNSCHSNVTCYNSRGRR